jgi:hypothetical protein
MEVPQTIRDTEYKEVAYRTDMIMHEDLKAAPQTKQGFLVRITMYLDNFLVWVRMGIWQLIQYLLVK